MMYVNLQGLVPPHFQRLYFATDEVVAAAECVSISYRAGGGYTVPLSVNLRRLDDAVRAWRACIDGLALNSDTNGFDRSEGYSNGQTEVGAGSEDGARGEAQTERRAEATASGERKPPHRSALPASAPSRDAGTS